MQQRYVESAGDMAGFELWLATDIDVHVALLQQLLGFFGSDASSLAHQAAVTPAPAACKEVLNVE